MQAGRRGSSAATSWFSLSVGLFLFCVYIHSIIFLDSTYEWHHIVFVFLCLISLSIVFSRSIHVATNGTISFFFNGWVIFHRTLAKLLQLYPTLCDPLDCSSPGSCVHGILQTRILEWVAMPSSKGSSQPRDWTQVSCIGRRVLYH